MSDRTSLNHDRFLPLSALLMAQDCVLESEFEAEFERDNSELVELLDDELCPTTSLLEELERASDSPSVSSSSSELMAVSIVSARCGFLSPLLV